MEIVKRQKIDGQFVTAAVIAEDDGFRAIVADGWRVAFEGTGFDYITDDVVEYSEALQEARDFDLSILAER